MQALCRRLAGRLGDDAADASLVEAEDDALFRKVDEHEPLASDDARHVRLRPQA